MDSQFEKRYVLALITRNLLSFAFPSLTLDTSEVSAKVEYIKVRLERFQDLLNNTNTAQNRDFQDLRRGGCAGGTHWYL